MQKLTIVFTLLCVLVAVNGQATECSCTCTTASGIATTIPVSSTAAEFLSTTLGNTEVTDEDTTELSSPFTTEQSSTVRAPSCDQIGQLIEVSNDNTTELTTALNDAIATWNTTEANNFRGYNKRIQTIIWTDEDTEQSKEEQIAQVVSGFSQNVARLQMVYDIQIGSFGTVGDFVHCVNELYNTDYQEL
ncbi:hypothetical protein M3Y95_00687500 [Aphelenchoides besseyi]|nr:hypothetical protein M3Y95_00687500 [Aphelenchoides besseyi]